MALRVPIRQPDNRLKAVMTAGVRVNNPTFQANLPDYHRIDIIRADRYFQYSSEFFSTTKWLTRPQSQMSGSTPC
ncbi:hypothetical protein QW180_31150 [Vibrio sinaloensis]|nr:hypothetical protein [Vibrio sinaloensis]